MRSAPGSAPRKALEIAALSLRRLFRQRTTFFFVFLLPMILILALGASFGGGFTPKIGVVRASSGPFARALVARVDRSPDVDVKAYSSVGGLRTGVQRNDVSGGMIVPANFDSGIRAGRPVTVRYLSRSDRLGQQLRTVVQSAVGKQSITLVAGRFAVESGQGPFGAAVRRAALVAPAVPGVSTETTIAGTRIFPKDLGRFDVGASTQLLLFIFLTSLTSAVALIDSRRLGVSRRMLSTPTPIVSILGGEALGRFGVALLQGVLIMLGSMLFFGVSWGDPAGAVAVLMCFCLVGAGAGMLLGSVLSNQQQASSVALLLGLGLAALGGSMAPLEIFPSTVRTIAHVTPHAWGNDAFTELVGRGGGLGSIAGDLAVLLGYAAVLFAAATWALRRALTRGG